MPSKKPRQQRFFGAVKQAKKDPSYGSPEVRKVANSMSDTDVDDFLTLKTELKMKKAILAILKDSRGTLDEYYYNSGEETKGQENAITKEFNVEGKFEEYVKRYLGSNLSEKEMEAVNTFQDVKPTKIESTQIRYETTDAFKNNTTTIIKKLREGSDFVYVAFTKYGKAEKPQDQQQQGGDMSGGLGGGMGGPMLETDQPTPSNDMSIPSDSDFGSGFAPFDESKKYWDKFLTRNEAKAYLNYPERLTEQGPMDSLGAPPMGSGMPPTSPMGPIPGSGPSTTTAPMTGTPKTPDQRKKEMGVDDILVRKSTTFKDDIKGGSILAEFLKKLDL